MTIEQRLPRFFRPTCAVLLGVLLGLGCAATNGPESAASDIRRASDHLARARTLWRSAFHKGILDALVEKDSASAALAREAESKLIATESKGSGRLSANKLNRAIEALLTDWDEGARQYSLDVLRRDPRNTVARFVNTASEDSKWRRLCPKLVTGYISQFFLRPRGFRSGPMATRPRLQPEQFWEYLLQTAKKRSK